MRSLIFAALLLPIFNAGASQLPVVFHQTFKVETATVVAPNLIDVTTTFNGTTELARLKINLSGVDFGSVANRDCVNSTGKTTVDCDRLDNFLANKLVQINLRSYNRTNDSFDGKVFVDGQSLKNSMLSEGWYRHDYKKSRNKYSIILQKSAMCRGKGIWRELHSTMTDLECN